MEYKSLNTVSSKKDITVIDNSIIVRWLIGDGFERDIKIANSILSSISRKELYPVIPSLGVYEASNVIATYVKRNQLEESIGLKRLTMSFDVCNIVEFKPDLTALTQIAVKYNLSSYDATYLYLADQLSCCLATLDKKLAKAVIQSKDNLLEL